MTKEQLQKELVEKVKEGVKPSDIKRLKRSKSCSDIPVAPPLPNINDQKENTELKTKISQLEDQIIELRISKLKEFGDYLEQKKDLEKDLDTNINYGTKEIERLENKLRTINKKKLELQDQLSQTQSKNAKLELKLIEEQNKENPLPTSDWTNYTPILLLLIIYALALWLTNKNQSHYG